MINDIETGVSAAWRVPACGVGGHMPVVLAGDITGTEKVEMQF
jgi:hypothetical protein